MKTKLFIIVLAMFLNVGLFAQNNQVQEQKKSRKELRAERKAARKREIEENRQLGKTLLVSKNFVMKVDMMRSARTGEMVQTMPSVNFIKIDGDDISVQFGDVSEIGLNGVGGVTYSGKIQTYELFDRGEGKSAGVRIQFSSIYARNIVSLYIEITGDSATARFNENGIIINMYGQYEAYEGSMIWEGQNRRDF